MNKERLEYYKETRNLYIRFRTKVKIKKTYD